MRGRIFEALGRARGEACPPQPHEARTWQLARAALERNDALGWKLEESAERLRVQTIDALCASLTRQMPVLSRFGGQPESVEDASAMYVEAARALLAHLEEGDADIARLLGHVDNDVAKAEKLLADMLASRDHWIRTLLRRRVDRDSLEVVLSDIRAETVARVQALWPPTQPGPDVDDVAGWIAFAPSFLTQANKWRASSPAVLRDTPGLLERIKALRTLPPAMFDDAQWEALQTIVRLAPRALAELQVVFARRGQADFIEISQGALRALGPEGEPTDLMLALDYRIRHILVDEFQDTSFTQFDLLERLTAGWEPHDGRTLFLVGDPMQSIYRFREAEVALFIRAWNDGIGDVKLERLTLSANFRSQSGIVEWVNASF
jgi:ATP-dependent exoDNAse (exonuclease V) beta subunit